MTSETYYSPGMQVFWTSLITLACLPAGGCGNPSSSTRSSSSATASTDTDAVPAVQLVESWPVETALGHSDIPDAHEVWMAMFDAAEKTIDVEEFYISNQSPSRLDAIFQALERAAARGVAIRLLVDKQFYSQYKDIPDRLGAVSGVELRVLDIGALTGGVQHAKFFIVDSRDAYLGSQNLDWRSITHIYELGARIRQPALVATIAAVFEMDWRLARTRQPDAESEDAESEDAEPEDAEKIRTAAQKPLAAAFPVTVEYRGQPVEVRPGFSPTGWLPDEALWDLPMLISLLDSATDRVRVQLLSYSIDNYDGSRYRGLDDALRRAAARGARVELLLADWNKDEKVGALQALQRLDGVTVKLATIPEHSSGFIPFARVIHAKLITVDGARSWLSTSNFSGDYFHKSRNLSLFFAGARITDDLDRFFSTVWSSEYAYEVDPDASYQPPRIAE